MAKITDALVRELEAPVTGNKIVWDSEHKDAVTGFGVRITAKAARSFVLRYIFDGKEFRHTIGAYPAWSVVAARDEAKTWRKRVDRGESHPLGAKRAAREAAAERAKAKDYAAAVEDYHTREQVGRRQNATANEVRRALLYYGNDWKAQPVADITAAMIRRKLETLRDGDPKASPPVAPRGYTANRLHAYLSTFFKWAAEPGIELVPASPMTGLRRPWEGEERRDRVFSDDELKALWLGATKLDPVPAAFLKVAILTGKRKTALASMQWADLSEDGVWTPPADTRRKTRNKRLHGIPLPKLAQRVIAPLRPKAGDPGASPYVFPGRLAGSHLNAGSDFMEDVREASGIADYLNHALRHTLETRFAKLKVPPHIRDAALDHVPNRGSGAGYDHYDYVAEVGEALEKWAAYVERLVSPNGAKVLR